MKRLFLALAILSMIGPAARADILLPPERFDHPYPDTRVQEMSLQEVEQTCDMENRHSGIMACVLFWSSYKVGDTCIQVLPVIGPGGVSLRDRALLRRHEDGHCNQGPRTGQEDHEGWR
jgi:hypothetical protein